MAKTDFLIRFAGKVILELLITIHCRYVAWGKLGTGIENLTPKIRQTIVKLSLMLILCRYYLRLSNKT